MNLDDTQKTVVTRWIEEGLKLSDIQKRMETELGIRMTYMELRLLVDDLKLTPKDVDRPSPPVSSPLDVGGQGTASARKELTPQPEAEPDEPGAVSVSVDALARPGTLASGGVTFSDGQSGKWYLDQSGRLGVIPSEQGYKPSALDVQEFQMQLQEELRKMGYG